MRITLLNPRHSSIGSRIPDEHLPPLGLLSIGGPLIDAGHHVTLVDADLEDAPDDEIVRRICALTPDVIMVGHSGSTSADPVVSRLAKHRNVIQTNRERWDYKHQVLRTRHLAPWQVLAWVKLTEVVLQARPRAIWRTFLQPDAELRDAMQWYTRMGRRVWPFEVWNFFFRDRRTVDGPTLEAMWGAPQAKEEQSMVVLRRGKRRGAAGPLPTTSSKPIGVTVMNE